MGYRAQSTTSGDEAVRILDESVAGDIDLLLTDVNMPLMSGIELAFRTQAAHPNVRLLFMSAYTDIQIPTELGAGFVAKGFTIAELSLEVEQALNRGPRPVPDPPQLPPAAA
ncbi:MAG: response regulator [SAR202 cluster bacterium]|nr:response regulator [SAR202 cluster bacterium]MDP6665139.1 response regulator [SAR202 cluster bacterium]MDP6801028.1 response regulator [SAR202 cluster bacterium]